MSVPLPICTMWVLIMLNRIEIDKTLAKTCLGGREDVVKPHYQYFMVFGVDCDQIQVLDGSGDEVLIAPIAQSNKTVNEGEDCLELYRDTIRYFKRKKRTAMLIFYSIVAVLVVFVALTVSMAYVFFN